MEVMLSENVIHFHKIKISDELEIEKIINMANNIKKRCNTGYEAVETVLKAYKDKFGDAFDYEVIPNACGTEFEELNFEYFIKE